MVIMVMMGTPTRAATTRIVIGLVVVVVVSAIAPTRVALAVVVIGRVVIVVVVTVRCSTHLLSMGIVLGKMIGQMR